MPENVIYPVSNETGQSILSTLEDMAEAITPVNPYIDLAVTIPTNGWSNSAPYTYTWLNENITTACEVEVSFTGSNPISYISSEKVGGGVKFTAPYKPTSDISVMVRVIKAEADSITSVDATMVSTNAVSGASNVEQGLASHSQAIGNLSNLPTTEKGSLVGAANELSGKIGAVDAKLPAVYSKEITNNSAHNLTISGLPSTAGKVIYAYYVDSSNWLHNTAVLISANSVVMAIEAGNQGQTAYAVILNPH